MAFAVKIVPDAIVEFSDLGSALDDAIGSYLRFFPKVPPRKGAIRISGVPPPTAPNRPSSSLTRRGVTARVWPGLATLTVGSVVGWICPVRGRGGVHSVGGEIDGRAAVEFVALALAPLLAEAVAPRGWSLVHAGGVKIANGGLLLLGPSGAGKSTIVGQAADAGHLVFSDDLMWWRTNAVGAEIAAFPRGEPAVPGPPTTAWRARLDGIVVLSRADSSDTRWRNLRSTRLLPRLDESTARLGAVDELESRFHRLTRIVGLVPGFELDVGDGQCGVKALEEMLELNRGGRRSAGGRGWRADLQHDVRNDTRPDDLRPLVGLSN